MFVRNQLCASGVILCCAVGLLVGCAGGNKDMPALGTVHGTVKLQGTPLANALVEFLPADTRGSQGMTDSEGAYTLDFDASHKGAAIGEHTVRISTKVKAVDPEEKVPPQYNVNSTLKETVKAGDNTINFDL